MLQISPQPPSYFLPWIPALCWWILTWAQRTVWGRTLHLVTIIRPSPSHSLAWLPHSACKEQLYATIKGTQIRDFFPRNILTHLPLIWALIYVYVSVFLKWFQKKWEMKASFFFFFPAQLARIVYWKFILPWIIAWAPFFLLSQITLIMILAAIWVAPCNDEQLWDDFEAGTITTTQHFHVGNGKLLEWGP